MGILYIPSLYRYFLPRVMHSVVYLSELDALMHLVYTPSSMASYGFISHLLELCINTSVVRTLSLFFTLRVSYFTSNSCSSIE
jgi:hypothetical protein